MKLIIYILLTMFSTNHLLAYDIWFVTNKNHIFTVGDVDTYTPSQRPSLTYASVPDAYSHDFGDIGFAHDGILYGISMTFGVRSALYGVDITSGAIGRRAGVFPFEWANALCFDINSSVAYVGGGLESSSPYQFLKSFRTFIDDQPLTSSVWYDMSIDYPSGGSASDFAIVNNKIYAIWLVANGATYDYYLLEFAKDGSSYTNLGRADLAISDPNGLWGLASDGEILYANSPSSLYRIDINNSIANYTKVMDFTLGAGEKVNGATSKRTDLSITQTLSDSTPEYNQTITITTTIRNDGSYSADLVSAKIVIPIGYKLLNVVADRGSFDQSTGVWRVGSIADGEAITLSIELQVDYIGTLVSSAEIVSSSSGDFDSHVRSSFDVDDMHDGIVDDDEVITRATVSSYISGAFWIDCDYDGVMEDDEGRVEGIRVELLDGDGNPTTDIYSHSTTTTDKDGKYRFIVASNHTYRVRFYISDADSNMGYIFTQTDRDDGLHGSDADIDGITQAIVVTSGQYKHYDAGIVCGCAGVGDSYSIAGALTPTTLILMMLSMVFISRRFKLS